MYIYVCVCVCVCMYVMVWLHEQRSRKGCSTLTAGGTGKHSCSS